MPSQTLQALSDQIENQATDHFGKFYMYASLLNIMTVRKKSFLETLPKYSGLTGKQPIFGEINPEFSSRVDNYKLEFIPNRLDPVSSVLKIIQVFLRKGQLSDLFFVINKMNEHLKTTPLADKKYNFSLYSNISFERRMPGVIELLECAQNISNLSQKSVDGVIYGFLTFFGALLALHVTQALGGIALSMLLLTAAGYSSYWFLQNAANAFTHLAEEVRRCNTITKNLINHQTGNIYTPNNLNFIIKSVLAPIDYMGVTVQEQMSPTDKAYQNSQENRLQLDLLFRLVDQSSEPGAIMRIELK